MSSSDHEIPSREQPRGVPRTLKPRNCIAARETREMVGRRSGRHFRPYLLAPLPRRMLINRESDREILNLLRAREDRQRFFATCMERRAGGIADQGSMKMLRHSAI